MKKKAAAKKAVMKKVIAKQEPENQEASNSSCEDQDANPERFNDRMKVSFLEGVNNRLNAELELRDNPYEQIKMFKRHLEEVNRSIIDLQKRLGQLANERSMLATKIESNKMILNQELAS